MTNKRFKIFSHIIIAVLFLAVGVVLMCSSQRSVKAYSQSDVREFNQLNVGYSVADWVGVHHYSAGGNELIDIYYSSPRSSSYVYYIVNVPADNPAINNIILSITFQGGDSHDMVYTLNGVDLYCECGFYSGTLPTASQLDNYFLPYRITTENAEFYPYEYSLFTLDISDTPYYTESYGYFILRFSISFYNEIDSDVSPFILLSDLNLSASYYEGYEAGKRAGQDLGYSKGKMDGAQLGYWNGYADGSQNPSADYHINDLLFSIYDVPYQVLYNLFSFTIFGVPAWTILISMLMILVIIWIIKKLVLK